MNKYEIKRFVEDHKKGTYYRRRDRRRNGSRDTRMQAPDKESRDQNELSEKDEGHPDP